MSSPTSPEQNYPQGGAQGGVPQGQPDWNTSQQPAPGYQPAPQYSGAPAGYGAQAGQRPGMVTAAGVIGIVWGRSGCSSACSASASPSPSVRSTACCS